MPPGQLQKNKQQQRSVLTPQKLELLNENRKLLSHIFNMGNSHAQHNLHRAMLRMRAAMIEKKIDVSKISKKIKGKIVSQLLRYESHTSLHEAFFRWKVRADPEIVKKAVDQILLNSRLNEFNAFHKLKNLIGLKDPQKKMNAKKRKNMCLINLALFLQKKDFQLKTAAISALKPKNQDSDKMLGLLLWSISSKHRERYLREKFNWWRLFTKVKSDKLQKQLKALERLGDEYNMRNDRLDRQRLKEAFEKWRGDLMNFRLKKKFFSVLLKTTFGRLQRCYTRWVDLPDKRENDMKKQGMLLITKLSNKADQNKRIVWNSFKTIDDDAKNKKTKVIRELIEVTFNQSYTAFYKWANYNTYAKLTETNLKKIKALQASANVTQQLVKLETFKLFGLSQKAEICSFLNKLILKIQQRQKMDALRQIENVSMQKKMQEKLDNINKQEIISRLGDTANKTEKGLLRQVLRKFALMREQSEIKNKYFGRIILTTSGMAMDAFRRWKQLPDPSEQQMLQNVSKFQLRLQFLFKQRVKQSFDPLKEVYYQGTQCKRLCVKQMLVKQLSAPQRFLRQWQSMNKIYKSVIACQKTNNFFDSLQEVLRNNIRAFLYTRKDAEVKEKCLVKLMSSFTNNLMIAFLKWKNYNKQQKISEKLGDEKKRFMLINLQRFINNDNLNRLRRILRLFYNEQQVNQLIKKIHLRVLQTQIGQVESSFQKWKSLPGDDALKNQAKVSKFAISLGKITYRFIKLNSWDQLENQLLDGQAKKKFCINKIIAVTQSDLKKAFLLWHRKAWEMKMFDKFSQLNVTLNDQIVKQKLIGWINAGSKVKFHALTEVLRRFNKNAIEQNLKRKALSIINRNTISQVWLSFNRWKQLPEDNNQLQVKASVFEKSLNKFIIHIARKCTWNPLQEAYDDALAIKKRAVLLMIKTQESEQQRTLDQWNKNVQLIKEVEKCKFVINLFGFLGLHIKNNIAPLKPDEESQKKEKALLRLIGNFDSNLRYFFMKWYNDGKLLKLQGAMNEEKKKLLLEAINNFSKNNDFAKLRAILAKFKRNSSVTAVQDRFFAKLFATQFGGAIVAFQKWKNLPEPVNTEQLKNARKFERKLDILFHTHLKVSFDPLKEDYMDAQNIKRMCLRKIFEKGMSAHKRLFLLWAQQNRQAKQIELCKLTTSLFVGLAQIVTANVQPIMQNPREAQAKEKALHLIFQGQAENLSRAFFLWRNKTQQDRMHQNFEDALTVEKKKQLTEQLVQFEHGNKFALYRAILAKFSLAHKKERLILQINARILRTQIGAVWDTFNKWKNLPEANAEELVKASKFEAQLNKFALHIWRKRTWNPLQEVYDDAQALKKRAIILMIKTQESEQQRALDQWNKNVGLIKEVERCKCVIGLFGFIGLHIKNNIAPLKPDEESQKKEKALLRLIGNFDSNLRYFFMKWYNDGKLLKLQGAMNEEKKKLLLEAINNFSKNNDFAKLRAILAKFKRNSSVTAVQDRFFAKLFATQFGGAIVAFQKWKNLPEPVNTEQLKNARKFERKLDILFHTHLKVSFDPLKEDYMDAQNIKRMCLRKIFEKGMSAHKRLFLLWAQQNRQAKQIELCKLTTSLFVGLAQIVTANVQPIMQNPREAQAKEKALHLIFQGQAENLSRAFFLWRNKTQQDRMHQNFEDALTVEKKKQLTEQLVQFEHGNKFALYRAILAKFSLAHKKERLILQINARILRTQIGAVWDTFNKWKNLPEANAEELVKASKFEAQLNKFALHIWRKRTWNPLQEVYDDAQALKKRAIILMIKTQESEQQRALDQWNKNVGLIKEMKNHKRKKKHCLDLLVTSIATQDISL
ncbi:unnamed protein product [Paramecium primaurelia]|uniref:Uncharacterized protein n=1 Tax=Paramecium primaurelia TaxID=5886 RepID=A0A8S1Q3W0_PARPR|nr:unnamed protein product [Paramecium primaurelia]